MNEDNHNVMIVSTLNGLLKGNLMNRVFAMDTLTLVEAEFLVTISIFLRAFP